MQDVVQRTENFVLWPLIYGQWNNLVTTSVYLHFISLLYMCLPNYWLKDIADKQMFYFRSILKSRKQMTKYSDPADICRYNLLKQSLNKLPQENSICKSIILIHSWYLSGFFHQFGTGRWVPFNWEKEHNKKGTLEKFFFICTIVMKFMISVIYSNTN